MRRKQDFVLRHPYYDYTLTDAKNLAASLDGAGPRAGESLSDREALEIICWHLKDCGFNWITAQVARDVLRAAISGKEVEV